MKKILVTGGAGYIGSHTVLELLKAGFDVVVFDNFSNSSSESLDRVREIVGFNEGLNDKLCVVQGDVTDKQSLERLFSEFTFEVVIHFAGLKAVGESSEQPLRYYQNNVVGSIALLEVMNAAGVFNLVFSSSATVYGDIGIVPVSEISPIGMLTNPYGRSKLIVEEMLQDIAKSNPSWSVAILRYFNPVGAHESGLIGEDPHGMPNNLVPYINQVAMGITDFLLVYGDDYQTRDGTGVRDYIHVSDLARGHLAAMKWMARNNGVGTWNLGTGKGYSVLEVVAAFEKSSGKQVPYKIAPRRKGDVAECFADPAKAASELGWHAEYDLARMMEDSWRWQVNNPMGYTK